MKATLAANGLSSLRFLALGDSYTIGEGVSPAACWPFQLAAALRGRGVPMQFPLIIAHTGWTTSELAAGIAAAAPRGTFDLVTLLIGVNNQYRGLGLEQYRDEFRSLLAQATAFAGGQAERVLVLSIPDWSVTPFAAGTDLAQIVKEIEAFNQANREETLAAGAHYLDITPISRQAAHTPGLLAADNLHPSGKMYARWVELALRQE
jgi:lysophospholipase L1-like esterase